MLKAVKVQLYPDKEQQQIVSSQICNARYVYKWTLALQKYAYQEFVIKVGKFPFALIKCISQNLKNENKPLGSEKSTPKPSKTLLPTWTKPISTFFKGGGFPKFKSKHHSKQSYQYPERVKIDDKKVFLPKVGWVIKDSKKLLSVKWRP